MRQAGKCVHFNGCQNDRCAAGVSYAELRGDRIGLPCLAKYAPADGPVCDKRREPTPEECAADLADASRRFEQTKTARAAIVARIGPYKRGVGASPSVSGRMDCPVCGKPDALHYSRAGRNGHVHAHCATAGCVSWME
jgi:hypothetical protein